MPINNRGHAAPPRRGMPRAFARRRRSSHPGVSCHDLHASDRACPRPVCLASVRPGAPREGRRAAATAVRPRNPAMDGAAQGCCGIDGRATGFCRSGSVGRDTRRGAAGAKPDGRPDRCHPHPHRCRAERPAACSCRAVLHLWPTARRDRRAWTWQRLGAGAGLRGARRWAGVGVLAHLGGCAALDHCLAAGDAGGQAARRVRAPGLWHQLDRVLCDGHGGRIPGLRLARHDARGGAVPAGGPGGRALLAGAGPVAICARCGALPHRADGHGIGMVLAPPDVHADGILRAGGGIDPVVA